jgi:AAA15 family ATPase/GTPase
MSIQKFHRQALIAANITPQYLQKISDCLLITSPLFSDKTDWSKLENDTFVSVSVFWISSQGFPFEISNEARLMFIFIGEADKNTTQLHSNLPLTVSDFSSKISPIVLSIGGRGSYRKLLSNVNKNLAKKLLLAANDIAALFAFKPNNKDYLAARSHDLFDRGMLRTDEQRFTFISLHSLLTENQKHSGVDISKLETRLILENETYIDVAFDFTETLGQQSPINIIIGPNGAGKTRLILAIARNSLTHKLKLTPSNHNSGEKSPNSVPMQVYTYEKSIWRSISRKGISVSSLEISNSNWKNLTDVILKIARTSSENGFDLKALSQILSKIIYIEDVYLPAHPNSGSTTPIERYDTIPLSELIENCSAELISLIDIRHPPVMYSEYKGFYHLSSGQKSLFCFSAALFQKTSRGSLLLIDEPENHLHPQFITLLMQTLASTLIAKEAKAIVVTHSPYIVRESEKTSVSVLKKSADGLQEIYRPSLQTLGADISLISDYVFEDIDIRKGYEEKIDEFVESPDITGSSNQLDLLRRTFGSDAINYINRRYKGRFDA